jgi:Leucine-rich repeat (LRR) protein
MKNNKWILLFFLFTGSYYLAQIPLLDSTTLVNSEEFTDLLEALKEPDKVIKLVLRRQKLKEFPKSIYKFKNLQYLDLSKNSIKELPDSITQLKNLQYLIVSKTGLETLPTSFGNLESLKYLNLNQNEIYKLPYSFGNLTKLEHADLWNNNLDYFPESLKKLTHLKSMDLRNILIPQEHQNNLQALLPSTIIYFSPPCRCSW